MKAIWSDDNFLQTRHGQEPEKTADEADVIDSNKKEESVKKSKPVVS